MEKEFKPENPIETLEKKLKSLEDIILKDWYLRPDIQKEGEELAKKMRDSLAYSKNTNELIEAGIYATTELLREVEAFKDKAIKHIQSNRESH